jgi:hypothetical protein
MGNVPVNNSYPAVEFQPTETDGVNHNDQEYTDSVSGNSYMFRTYNAEYVAGTGWTVFNGSLPAFATVQNPDGSIHYYTLNTGTGVWEGSDNNTIYNAVDFGTPALTAGGTASDNTAALGSLFTAMGTATSPALVGGMARIPQYNFPVMASTTGQNLSEDTIIQGLGTGGSVGASGTSGSWHFQIGEPVGPGGPYMFLTSSGSHTSGGTYLKNLSFRWNAPMWAGDSCLYLSEWNNVVDGCTFTDCPTAMSFQMLGGSARQCVIVYGTQDEIPTDVTAIVIEANQTEISGPSEFIGNSATTGTQTCIGIGGGTQNCNHNTLRNLHIAGWNYGVDYSNANGNLTKSGTQDTVIDGCQFSIYGTAINMVPADATHQIFDQTISNCVIYKNQAATDASPIVFIDSKGDDNNSNVGPVFLVNNIIYSNIVSASAGGTGVAPAGLYGVRIGNCQYVSIIGGQISQVGTVMGNDGTANVCISGSPTQVLLDSVNLAPTYAGVNTGSSTGTQGSAASEYALLISGNPTYVTVNNCPMIGFTGAPVSVTGTPGNLYITNCAGYNDQNTHLNGGAAPLSALSAATCSTRYFGPSVFTWTNSTPVTVHVFGTSYTASSGIIYLPSPYDTFYMSTAPLVFSWIGK